MNSLNAFAKAVEQSGKRFYSIRYMHLFTQKVSPLIFLILLVGCTNGLTPLPFKIFEGRHFIYLDPKDPNDVSLRNSDPSTYQYRSEIDFSKGPEIL
jgi:hypothetical protein